MNLTSQTAKRLFKRKIATAALITASMGAFATLGDGGRRLRKNTGGVLMPYTAKNFSLRSNYNYKSNILFGSADKKNFIMLNQMITYQKGNSTFILPLKKLPLMGKIKFNPAQ